MKRHIQDFRSFSINEGFERNPDSARDADLLELGIEYFGMAGEAEPGSDAEIVRAAKRLLQGASPVPLSGSGDSDIFSVASYIGSRLTDAGINLDQGSMRVSQDAFQNQVFVPIQGHPDLGITFNLDYSELLYQSGGRGIQVPFSFHSTQSGDEASVRNPADSRRLMAAARAFKQEHGI